MNNSSARLASLLDASFSFLWVSFRDLADGHPPAKPKILQIGAKKLTDFEDIG